MKKCVLVIVLLMGSLYAQSWRGFGTGLEYPVNSIINFNNKIYAASGGVYSWNGSSWVNNSDGMIALMDVYSLAVYNTTLFSGGFFTVLTPEGNWYNNAARYNGASWTTCGTGMGNDGIGMSDYVNTMIVHNGQLYAGGRFGYAGGDPWNQLEVNYIARFDGSLWNTVGSGVEYTVTDLAVYNDELIASGFFTAAGGVPANYIAKWNGSVWSALGSGMDAKVTALAVYNGELYAGGAFTTAGGNPSNGVAKWNGSSWSSVGEGITGGQVYTLAVYNNELYAGGSFRIDGGNAGENIQKWNGSQWINCGNADGAVVYIYPNGGELIVGGNFDNIGGTAAQNIAAIGTPTGADDEGNLPDEYMLSQNYPNPFNPSTMISFQLPESGNVTLKVYDTMGRETAVILNEYMDAGKHEIKFNGEGLTSGIYFYKISAGKFIECRKMVLTK
jgi:hypothetical protein